MSELKLIALDADDLAVVSAHLQDAIMNLGDIRYLPREKRFVAIVNRFDWLAAIEDGKGKREYARRRAAVRFERVLGAQVQGVDLQNKRAIVSLLAIGFEPGEAPAGHVTLHLADGGAVRLKVECVEAEMKDLGPVWQAKSKPQHPEDVPAGTQES